MEAMAYYTGSGGGSGEPPASSGRAMRAVKKTAVALAGLSAVGGGAYFGTTLLTGNRPHFFNHQPAALAPGPASAAPSVSASSPSPTDQPLPRPQLGTKSGARQSLRPSPTPSELQLSDPEVAAAQVTQLLQGAPAKPSGLSIASAPVTVGQENGTDGSTVRVVSAHSNLTANWSSSAMGDTQTVGDAICTQTFQVGPAAIPLLRPTMLMCWRASGKRSVVTVATVPTGHPLPSASVNILDRQWSALALGRLAASPSPDSGF